MIITLRISCSDLLKKCTAWYSDVKTHPNELTHFELLTKQRANTSKRFTFTNCLLTDITSFTFSIVFICI